MLIYSRSTQMDESQPETQSSRFLGGVKEFHEYGVYITCHHTSCIGDGVS